MGLLDIAKGISKPLPREIIAGRGFFFAPAPFVSLKVTVRQPVDDRRMEQAVRAVEKAHPIINNVVVRRDGKLYFEHKGHQVKLFVHNVQQTESWEEVLVREVCKTVNIEEEPGVFVHVVDNNHSFDVIVISHHIYGDGVSLKQLLSDLLYCYATGKTVAVREPMTGLSKYHMPGDYHVAKDRKEKFYNLIDLWATRNKVFTFEEFAQLNAVHHQTVGYGMEYVTVTGEQLRRLKGTCKEHNVTMNSAITTAILAEVQGPQGAQAIVAANTRPLFGMDSCVGFANFASALNAYFVYDERYDFWENARAVDSVLADIKQNKAQLLETLYAFLSLNEDIFAASYLAKYGMYMDMEILMAMMDALNVGNTADAFSVSNLGLADFECASENFQITDCCFIPNMDLGTDYKFGVISIENCLSIVLSYSSKKINEQQACRILRNIVNKF